MKTIEGIPSSTELLERLASEDKPVILHFSRGKDSLAVWHKLNDHGIEVIPIHKSAVPGLNFVREDLDRYEQHFGVKIHDVPAMGFFRMLDTKLYQPPERCAILEAADLPRLSRLEFDDLMRHMYAEEDTWCLLGEVAADSSTRLMAVKRYGPVNEQTRVMKPLWDHGKKEMWEIARSRPPGVGIDYVWWKRSFDGCRFDYLKAIKENAPEDYDIIKSWFPLVELEFERGGWDGTGIAR